MPVHSYAAFGPREPLKSHTFEPGPLAANDVEIAVSHCGNCHSDLHLIDKDWGISSFPLTPALDRLRKNEVRYRAVLVN